jgi:hypothetical protein
VYVPTNHLYIGDIFLVNSEEIIRPNLSIREGIGRVLNFTHILLGYCAMQAVAALLVNVTGCPL